MASSAPGTTLTVTAGRVIKFAQAPVYRERVTLVSGVEGNTVVFTDYRDDSVGGDTNADAAATTPSPEGGAESSVRRRDGHDRAGRDPLCRDLP